MRSSLLASAPGALLLALTLPLSAPAQVADTAEGPPRAPVPADTAARGVVDPPLGREALAERLDRLTSDPALERAHVGLRVLVAETGEVLYDRAGEKRFTAASTAKLVTGSVALERLGPDHRWRTRLVAAGPIARDTLRGDLFVVGDGDPTLDVGDLRRWARAIRGAGIRAIAGDLVGDGRAFPPPMWGRGWMWDELHLGWATGVTALQLSDAAVPAWLRPGEALGAPARVVPPEAALPVEVTVRTGPAGSETRLDFLPGPAGAAGRVVGWIPLDADRLRLSFAPGHPTDHLLAHLARVLEEEGVRVRGSLRTAGAEETVPEGSWRADFRSDPLRSVLATVLRTSDNQGAEALLRTLGRVEGREGSAREGLRVVEATLSGWGIEPGAVRMEDGSGLSRYDEVTPAALVRVLRTMWRSPHHEILRRALPAPEEWGTLRGRFEGTPAVAALRAKTGSLSSVRGLAGYVEDGDGETLIFALLLQGYDAPPGTATALRDLLVEQLSLFHRRVEPGWPAYRDGS